MDKRPVEYDKVWDALYSVVEYYTARMDEDEGLHNLLEIGVDPDVLAALGYSANDIRQEMELMGYTFPED